MLFHNRVWLEAKAKSKDQGFMHTVIVVYANLFDRGDILVKYTSTYENHKTANSGKSFEGFLIGKLGKNKLIYTRDHQARLIQGRIGGQGGGGKMADIIGQNPRGGYRGVKWRTDNGDRKCRFLAYYLVQDANFRLIRLNEA